MAIQNRELGHAQQRNSYECYVNGAVATGVSGIICIVPYTCSLDAAQIVAFGVSGSPTYGLAVSRWINGTGATSFAIVTGSSNTVASFGTSGPGSFGSSSLMVIPQIGGTLTTLLPNDVLMFQSGGANSAVTALGINVVLRPISDIQKFFGQV